MLERVWVVSYFEFDDREATITVFSNEEAAKKCFESFKKTKSHVAIDKTYVYRNYSDEVK